MKNIILTLMAILPLIQCNSASDSMVIKLNQKNGNEGPGVQETRNISGFSEIKACCGVEITTEQSNTFEVIVQADSRDKLAQIITEVSGNTLKIDVEGRKIDFNPKVFIKMPKLESYVASAGTSNHFINEFNVNSLNLSLDSGSSFKGSIKAKEDVQISSESGSSVNLNLSANNVNINCESGSSVKIIGEAKYVNANAYSGSSVNLKNLEVPEATLKAKSGSSISVVPNLAQHASVDMSSSIN